MCMVTLVYLSGTRVCESTYRENMVERIALELGNRLLGTVYNWKPGERVEVMA